MEAVIFDVDGTLVDSERHGHRLAFNEAFAALGMADHWDEEEYGELLNITGGRRRLATYLVGRGLQPAEAVCLADELHRVKTSRFRAMAVAGAVPLMPGVRRLVSSLRRAEVRLFVATTGSADWVRPLLDHHFDRSTFERVVTAADVARLKPEPDAYLDVVRRARLKSHRVVAIEDSVNGLRAAHGAGLPCLVVRNDYTGPEVVGAELVVSGFGPNALAESGVAAPMPHGMVTLDTINALAGTRPPTDGPRHRRKLFAARRRTRS